MKIKVAVEIEADQVACLAGRWYCGDNCQFNDSGSYCQLYSKEMDARLPECVLAQMGDT
jgi:hypothetical protein